MNSKRIEMNAIIKLRNELGRCDRIISEIPDNDRTPSWDGNIQLYEMSNLKKDNMQGIINVQVKGQSVKNIKKQSITYSVEVADLKNFRLVGGTIFFVVCPHRQGDGGSVIYRRNHRNFRHGDGGIVLWERNGEFKQRW